MGYISRDEAANGNGNGGEPDQNQSVHRVKNGWF